MKEKTGIKPIPGTSGGIVTGNHFYGRENDFKQLREILKTTNRSIILSDPRRTGKSSFLKEYQIRNKDGNPILYIYIQECTCTPELCKKIINRIAEELKGKAGWRKLINSISNEIDRLLKIFKKLKPREKTFKEQLDELTPLFQKLSEAGFVVALDEFADCILHMEKNDDGAKEVETFLLYLRALMQEKGCRFILSSSINLSRTIERMGHDHLVTDFSRFSLQPLKEKEILEFFKGLLLHHGVEITEECDNFILEKMRGGNHYHIQSLAQEVQAVVAEVSRPIGLPRLQELYIKLIEKKDSGLTLFHSRIEKKDHYSKSEKTIVLKILAYLSRDSMTLEEFAPVLRTDKTIVFHLLDRLIDEAYLKREGDQYVFFSPFFREWWRYHYGHET